MATRNNNGKLKRDAVQQITVHALFWVTATCVASG
jgi:hypothetical protein